MSMAMSIPQTAGRHTLHAQQTVAVSEPLKEVVGNGQNAKHIKECTELFLGNRNIEQLAGFERFVNLEVLWLNDNKLSVISGLDNNIRIKQLYAHNNHICTLKGSISNLKFLTHLDLSNNQLRDLSKLLKTLSKLHFISELNLQGNPCCEEPDYRLQLLHAMPTLQVLDHHQITTVERLQATASIGGNAHVLNVAFGAGIPASVLEIRTRRAECLQERSALEQELAKTAEAIWLKHQQATELAEAAQYAANPDADYWANRSSLPPPPGVAKAQQAWAAAIAMQKSNSSCTGKPLGSDDDSVVKLMLTQAGTSVQCQKAAPGLKGAVAACYKPKDVIVLHSYKRRSDVDNQAAGIYSCCINNSSSQPRYLTGTFGHHLTDRNWEVEAKNLKL